MIEAGAHEASEEDMLEALEFGQKYVKDLCEFEESIIEVVGQEKVRS
jgi:polyribonucleotide nucleotidyltransferase